MHLAVHSEYSVSDGLVKIKELAARAAEQGMPAVALTDRANLFGLVKFYSACRDAGIKAIIGADVDYEDADGAFRCILLVASEVGYRNLLRLVSARIPRRTAPSATMAEYAATTSSLPQTACWCCWAGPATSAQPLQRVKARFTA